MLPPIRWKYVYTVAICSKLPFYLCVIISFVVQKKLYKVQFPIIECFCCGWRSLYQALGINVPVDQLSQFACYDLPGTSRQWNSELCLKTTLPKKKTNVYISFFVLTNKTNACKNGWSRSSVYIICIISRDFLKKKKKLNGVIIKVWLTLFALNYIQPRLWVIRVSCFFC